MKKLLFIISFITLAFTATAQNMIVERSGADSKLIAFVDLKQITFDGTKVNIEQNNGTTFSTTMGEISCIYFDYPASIADVESQNGKLVKILSPDEIAINSSAGSMVTIYNPIGVQMITQRINAEGATISIAGLPQGIYIVKVNDRTTKFVKR